MFKNFFTLQKCKANIPVSETESRNFLNWTVLTQWIQSPPQLRVPGHVIYVLAHTWPACMSDMLSCHIPTRVTSLITLSKWLTRVDWLWQGHAHCCKKRAQHHETPRRHLWDGAATLWRVYQMPTQKIGFTVEISCQERPFSLSILFKPRPYIYQPHLSSVRLLHSHTISAANLIVSIVKTSQNTSVTEE